MSVSRGIQRESSFRLRIESLGGGKVGKIVVPCEDEVKNVGGQSSPRNSLLWSTDSQIQRQSGMNQVWVPKRGVSRMEGVKAGTTRRRLAETSKNFFEGSVDSTHGSLMLSLA